MNKFQRNLTVLAGIAIVLAACNKDRLDVEPVNEFLSSNYYQTESQVGAALIAVYDPLGWGMAYGQWVSQVMFGDIRSDNANAGGDPSNNDQPGWQEYDDFTNTNTNVVTHPISTTCHNDTFASFIGGEIKLEASQMHESGTG